MKDHPRAEDRLLKYEHDFADQLRAIVLTAWRGQGVHAGEVTPAPDGHHFDVVLFTTDSRGAGPTVTLTVRTERG